MKKLKIHYLVLGQEGQLQQDIKVYQTTYPKQIINSNA